MIKNLILTDKEHAFLVRILAAFRDEVNTVEEKRWGPDPLGIKLTVPERMDLNEIMKRLLSWK